MAMSIASPRLSDACGRSMTPPPGLKLPQGATLPVGFKPPPGLTREYICVAESKLAASTPVSAPTEQDIAGIVSNADLGETSAGSTASDGTASESDESFGGSPRNRCRTTAPQHEPAPLTIPKKNTCAANMSPPLVWSKPPRTALRSKAAPFQPTLPFVPMAEVKAAWQKWHAKHTLPTEHAWVQRASPVVGG